MKNDKKFKYDNVIKSYEPLSKMPIYEFSNLHLFENINKETVIMDGIFFVVSMATNYTHALLDVIGAYYQFKEIYPDLIPIFIKEKMNLKLFKYISLPLEEFAIKNNFQIINFENNNYLFKKAIMHNYYFSPVLLDSLLIDDSPIQKIFYKNSIQKILKEIKYDSLNSNKCIYVSRKLINKNRKLSDNKYLAFNFTYDEEYDIKLEEYFLNNGFEIVDLWDYNLSQQIDLFSKCRIIAGIQGTNLINSIWMNDNSKIFEIKIFENYFSWNNIFEAANKKNIYTCNVVGLNTQEGLNKIFSNFNKLF
jgi:hypothetical protein